MNFHHLSQDEGLSQGTNAYVMEDSRGFIWISSMNGLNRFDGKTVKTYLPDPEDPFSLAGGKVNSTFFEDQQNDIWFSSNVAVQRYIRQKDKFETIRLYDDRDSMIREDIVAFYLDRQQNLWLRVGEGDIGRLHVYNIISRKDSILCHLDGQRCRVLTDDEGRVLTIVSSMFDETWGFEILDLKKGTRQRYLSKSTDDSLRTYNIYIQDQKNIWFGSRQGLLHFDTETRQYQLYDTFQQENIGRIWQAIPWKDKLIVSSGLKGVLVFDPKSELFTQVFTEQYGMPSSLRQNNTYELYLDSQDILWVSLWGIGMDYAKLNKIKFKSALPPDQQISIRSVIEGPNGQIWCTTKNGILAISPNGELVSTPFSVSGWNEARHKSWIPMLFRDQQQRIWMSIYTDLFKYDKDAFHFYGTLKNYPQGVLTLSNGRTLISTNAGMFEMTDSLEHIVLSTPKEFEPYAQTPFENMYEDPSGQLYVSRNSQSLLVFKPDHNRLRLVKEILGVGDCKAFLSQPQTDSIFICIETGTILLDPKTLRYRRLQEKPDGLPAETYYCLIPDDNGKIWLAGNKGLIRYDPVKKEYHRYTHADGLQSLEFNPNAYCQSSSGEIWLGGTNGLTVFDPMQVTNITTIPQIQITHLLVNDEPYVTDTYIGEMTDLSLDYSHNTLSFEFVGLEFSDPTAIQYKYRMSGLENEWVESGTRNFARYPNIPPGDYKFEILASNSDGVWNEDNLKVLHISIAPPFTQTVWFYLLLALGGGSIIFLLYRFQLNRKFERAEKKRLLELDELKNKLYTNITHEFRTPLTLIHGPVSNALSTDQPLDKKDLKSIYRQSEQLQHLISQMLDLQKLEAGQLAPHFVYGDITQRIRYFFSSFETAARAKGIQLVNTSPAEETEMDYDEDKLNQIISNLVSNAIKHTPRNGKISLTIHPSLTKQILQVRIRDTGTGIAPEDLPFIFNRFYQSSRAAAGGTGIGLALTKNLVELLGGSISVDSTPDFGSTFSFSLPIRANAQKDVPIPVQIPESVHTEAMEDEIQFLPSVQVTPDKPIVLIVEDHPEVSRYIASCLEKDFIPVQSADGNEGIKKAFELIPDLVISDIMMPGKDGFDLCRTLKTDIQTSHIPIVLLTGRGDQAALMAGIEHGADAYVVKPFDPQELVLRVKKLLELRANLSQYYRQQSGEIRATGVQASAKENAFLQQIRTFIEEHLNESQFNMQMLSQHMSMSHSQLHRKITALTGESTGNLVRNVRLAKAKELLKNSDLTISEIAYETGFSAPSYFTRVFSKAFNISPSEFRET